MVECTSGKEVPMPTATCAVPMCLVSYFLEKTSISGSPLPLLRREQRSTLTVIPTSEQSCVVEEDTAPFVCRGQQRTQTCQHKRQKKTLEVIKHKGCYTGRAQEEHLCIRVAILTPKAPHLSTSNHVRTTSENGPKVRLRRRSRLCAPGAKGYNIMKYTQRLFERSVSSYLIAPFQVRDKNFRALPSHSTELLRQRRTTLFIFDQPNVIITPLAQASSIGGWQVLASKRGTTVQTSGGPDVTIVPQVSEQHGECSL